MSTDMGTVTKGGGGTKITQKVIDVPDYGRKATGGKKLFRKRSILVYENETPEPTYKPAINPKGASRRAQRRSSAILVKEMLRNSYPGSVGGLGDSTDLQLSDLHAMHSSDDLLKVFGQTKARMEELKDQHTEAKSLAPDVLGKLMARVGDWRDGLFSLKTIQEYLQHEGMQFDDKLLQEMFEEADFRKNGALTRDDMYAALTYRFKHRKHNKTWRKLVAMLLNMKTISDPNAKDRKYRSSSASYPRASTSSHSHARSSASTRQNVVSPDRSSINCFSTDNSRPGSQETSGTSRGGMSSMPASAWSIHTLAPSETKSLNSSGTTIKVTPVPPTGEWSSHMNKLSNIEAQRGKGEGSIAGLLPRGTEDVPVSTTWGTRTLKQSNNEILLNKFMSRPSDPEIDPEKPVITFKGQSKFRTLNGVLESQQIPEQERAKSFMSDPAQARFSAASINPNSILKMRLERQEQGTPTEKGFSTIGLKSQSTHDLRLKTFKNQSAFHGEFVELSKRFQLRSYKKQDPPGIDTALLESGYSSLVANKSVKAWDKTASLGYNTDVRSLAAAERAAEKTEMTVMRQEELQAKKEQAAKTRKEKKYNKRGSVMAVRQLGE